MEWWVYGLYFFGGLTFLLSPDLHARLTALGEQEGVSLGELVRRACERQYGLVAPTERLAAVTALEEMALPVGDVASMKQESEPPPAVSLAEG